MKQTIKVDGYNLATMTAKNWKFFQGGREISKTLAKEMVQGGSQSVVAKFKQPL